MLPFDGHAIRQIDFQQTLLRNVALVRQDFQLRQQRSGWTHRLSTRLGVGITARLFAVHGASPHESNERAAHGNHQKQISIGADTTKCTLPSSVTVLVYGRYILKDSAQSPGGIAGLVYVNFSRKKDRKKIRIQRLNQQLTN